MGFCSRAGEFLPCPEEKNKNARVTVPCYELTCAGVLLEKAFGSALLMDDGLHLDCVWPAGYERVCSQQHYCRRKTPVIKPHCLILFATRPWAASRHGRELPGMARRPLCELCQAHRPGSRRRCRHCRRRIGPGCQPEQCMWQELPNDEAIRRVCRRIYIVEAQVQLLARQRSLSPVWGVLETWSLSV